LLANGSTLKARRVFHHGLVFISYQGGFRSPTEGERLFRKRRIPVRTVRTEHIEEHIEQIARPKKRVSKKDLPILRFPEFWTAYPLKKGKQEAHIEYVRAVEGGAAKEDIIKGAIVYAASKAGEESRFIKHAQGWLNAERWLDEPDTPGKAKGAGLCHGQESSTWTREKWERAVFIAKRLGKWPASYGPVERIPSDLVDAELATIIRSTTRSAHSSPPPHPAPAR
jgi:hypothetical protein